MIAYILEDSDGAKYEYGEKPIRLSPHLCRKIEAALKLDPLSLEDDSDRDLRLRIEAFKEKFIDARITILPGYEDEIATRWIDKND